jgi:acyl CoA:acetate/3-ketoacid CoA transferase
MSNFKMLVAEQKDLAGRISLLADELAKAVKENKGEIDNVPLNILEHQLRVMGEYNKDLVLRIGIHTIVENDKNGSSKSS